MAKIFFYDLETTSVDYKTGAIHQISGMIEIDGEVKEDFNYKVQPFKGAIIEPKALEVGGVTEEQIMAYPKMNEAYLWIITMLDKYADKYDKKDKLFLSGFNNASFDNQFFREFFFHNADVYFGSWFWSNPLDVFVLATQKLLDIRHEMVDFKLKTVCKQMGIEVDETKLHDALYDIELTRQLYHLVTK